MTTALSGRSRSSRRPSRGAATVLLLALHACGSGGGAAPGGGAGALRLTIAPTAVTLPAAGTQVFTAALGGVASTDVRFELVAGPGSIDAAGVYSAPLNVSAEVTAVVRAVANVDPRAQAEASITVQPSAAAVQFGLGLKLAVAGGFDTGVHLRDRAAFAVDAVFEMTRLIGRVRPVTTGTLRLVGQAFAAEATPTDRLVVELGSQGGRTELVFGAFEGDLSRAAPRFLAGVHALTCRVLADDVDAELADRRVGNDVTRALRGIVTIEGQAATVHIVEQEVIDVEITPGVDFHALTAVTGTIDLAGVHVDLDEALDTRIAISNRAVEQFKRFQRSSWTVGTQAFALRDVEIFSLFVDARGDELDFWRGQGSVMQDNAVVGQFESAFETNDFVVRLRIGTQVFEARRIPVFVR
jgi:hypothetical protein